MIKEYFNFHWVGFYLVADKKRELFLGPYQGPIACTRIIYGQGVCGNAWEQESPLIVNDVHKFKGPIACSRETNSEIVLAIGAGVFVVNVHCPVSSHGHHLTGHTLLPILGGLFLICILNYITRKTSKVLITKKLENIMKNAS